MAPRRLSGRRWRVFLVGQPSGLPLTAKRPGGLAKGIAASLDTTVVACTIMRHDRCEGAFIFKHACALGCEGIVSKRP